MKVEWSWVGKKPLNDSTGSGEKKLITAIEKKFLKCWKCEPLYGHISLLHSDEIHDGLLFPIWSKMPYLAVKFVNFLQNLGDWKWFVEGKKESIVSTKLHPDTPKNAIDLKHPSWE